jgi:hypothetical protein
MMKVHILMGDYVRSTIGSKHVSLSCDPQIFLDDFPESNQLLKRSYRKHLWGESRPFNQLRMEFHIRARMSKLLNAISPHLAVSRKATRLLDYPHSKRQGKPA